ncbi:MAG: aminopeptidase N [Pseudomonadota bacterium]
MGSAAAHRTVHRLDYQPPPFWLDAVWLQFDLDDASTRLRSRLTVRRNPDVANPEGLWTLDGEALTLLGVRIDGQPLARAAYEVDEHGLTLRGLPEHFELEVDTRIAPADNTALSGLYVSNGVYCTQCEAEGFRRITYFPDRPDVLAPYRVVLRADRARCPVLLSNGNPVSTRAIDPRRVEAVWDDPHPKPAYLFALVAGDLACRSDAFTTSAGREVSLNIFTTDAYIDRTAHAMASLKRAMAWDEQRYGLAYDLDVFNIVAVDDFNMGAMENKGLNIFNTKYVLTDAETATDTDFLGVESVVAHEYFHNWTGNRVTCRDWFQLSLKEGLTVYRDQEFSSDLHVRALKRIEDVRLLKARQFPEDAGPMAHPIRPESYVEINNFYTLTVYEKGAEVVRLYDTLLGEDGFRRGMDLYIERHDGSAATCDDFRRAMADANGVDFTQFERWYAQAGTPELRVDSHHDAELQRFTLTFSQRIPGQAEAGPLVIPVRLGLLGRDGGAIPLRLASDAEAPLERVLVVDSRVAQFVFEGVASPPVVSLLRGFSAPVTLVHTVSDADNLVLLQHDSDLFNRWQAAQDMLGSRVRALADAAEPDATAELSEAVVDGLATVLRDGSLPPGVRAEALTLPDVNTVTAQLDTVDIDAVDRGLTVLKRSLAERLAPHLRAVVEAPRSAQFSLTPDAVGERALRALCLDWLSCSDPSWAHPVLADQYHSAGNMTDRLAALRIVTHATDPGYEALRAELLGDYEQRYTGDKLVMDKWFALQATSPRGAVVEDIRRLRQRADFDVLNPNRARALFGVFAFNNPVRFHAADGSGYRLLGDFLADYDAINPQTAARLASALAQWRRHTPARQAHARATLSALRDREGLSRDTWEIVSKALHDA